MATVKPATKPASAAKTTVTKPGAVKPSAKPETKPETTKTAATKPGTKPASKPEVKETQEQEAAAEDTAAATESKKPATKPAGKGKPGAAKETASVELQPVGEAPETDEAVENTDPSAYSFKVNVDGKAYDGRSAEQVEALIKGTLGAAKKISIVRG